MTRILVRFAGVFLALSGALSVWATGAGPNLVATKTDNVGGATTLGSSWTWTITVTNNGPAPAVFTIGQLVFSDSLPSNNIAYSEDPGSGTSAAFVEGYNSGVTTTNPFGNAVNCQLSGSDVWNCYAFGTVTIDGTSSPTPGSITVTIEFATATAPGTFTNPGCSVDPGHLVQSVSNTCNSDTVVVTGGVTSGNGAPFQIRYVSNLDVGDSVIDISNDGQSQPPSYGIGTSGGTNLCVGVYTFDANEELQSCCACLVTPNGLASLSAQAINATSLTGEKPTSLVVKLLAWSTTAGASSTAPPGTPAPPTSSSCNPATPGTLAAGMHAWGTTIHQLPVGNRSTYTVSETEFSPAALSAAEYAHITQSCEFNQINGSAQSGQCKGCASGGQ